MRVEGKSESLWPWWEEKGVSCGGATPLCRCHSGGQEGAHPAVLLAGLLGVDLVDQLLLLVEPVLPRPALLDEGGLLLPQARLRTQGGGWGSVSGLLRCCIRRSQHGASGPFRHPSRFPPSPPWPGPEWPSFPCITRPACPLRWRAPPPTHASCHIPTRPAPSPCTAGCQASAPRLSEGFCALRSSTLLHPRAGPSNQRLDAGPLQGSRSGGG